MLGGQRTNRYIGRNRTDCRAILKGTTCQKLKVNKKIFASRVMIKNIINELMRAFKILAEEIDDFSFFYNTKIKNKTFKIERQPLCICKSSM